MLNAHRSFILALIWSGVALKVHADVPTKEVASKPTAKFAQLQLQGPPPATVNSVAVSRDGALVATASDEGGIRIYDVRSGTLLRALSDGGDRCVAFSADGKQVAAAGFHLDKLIGIYDVQTGKRVQQLAGHTEWEIYAVAFSPDGKLFASAGRSDHLILVWELATGKLRHKIHEPSHSPTALAFSPDSATLASGGGDKTVRLWNTATGGMRQLLKGHEDWVCSLDFSDDGKTIASASCDWAFHRGRDVARFEGPAYRIESQWKLWDATSGELLRTATEPGRILSLSIAPNGAWLACGLDNDVRVYGLRAKTPGRVVTTHDALVTGVAFMPDGKGIVSSAHDHVVTSSNAADGQVQWRLSGQREQVNSVALSRDGTLLVTGTSDERFAKRLIKAGAPGIAPGAIRLWNAQTGQLLRRLGDPAEQVMTVAVSPDCKHVASGGTGNTRAGVANPAAGAVGVWDADTGAPVWSASDHTAEVLAVAFAPDGSSLAAADADGSVVMRNAKSGRTLFTLPGHEGGATSIAFAPSGEIVVCGQGHGGAHIWNAQSGRLLHTCEAEDSQAKYLSVDRLITSVAILPDGRTFAECIASMGNTYSEPLRFWDIQTGRLKAEMNDKRVGGGRPIVLSPNGTTLAAGGKSVQLWDVRTGNKQHRLQGILKKIQAIAFSPDGRLVYAGGNYGTTNVWDVASGQLLITLFTFADTRNETGKDDWLAYRPDGSYDGSPGADRYVAWRAGDELRTAMSHGNRRSGVRIKAAPYGEPSNQSTP